MVWRGHLKDFNSAVQMPDSVTYIYLLFSTFSFPSGPILALRLTTRRSRENHPLHRTTPPTLQPHYVGRRSHLFLIRLTDQRWTSAPHLPARPPFTASEMEEYTPKSRKRRKRNGPSYRMITSDRGEHICQRTSIPNHFTYYQQHPQLRPDLQRRVTHCNILLPTS